MVVLNPDSALVVVPEVEEILPVVGSHSCVPIDDEMVNTAPDFPTRRSRRQQGKSAPEIAVGGSPTGKSKKRKGSSVSAEKGSSSVAKTKKKSKKATKSQSDVEPDVVTSHVTPPQPEEEINTAAEKGIVEKTPEISVSTAPQQDVVTPGDTSSKTADIEVDLTTQTAEILASLATAAPTPTVVENVVIDETTPSVQDLPPLPEDTPEEEAFFNNQDWSQRPEDVEHDDEEVSVPQLNLLGSHLMW